MPPVAATDNDISLDANSLLSDLDKGLRSVRPGEQAEAIVRFPWLFERYPFPILVNSGCLKLADLFRTGSNFSRVLILRVIKQSSKHLDKISIPDEFIKRLFPVSYSNDPIARALTLRLLGAIAPIALDRKNIHQYIRDSLDSTDETEINAAIEAAASYATVSQDFAISIYPKAIAMITRPHVALETKIALLSLLHHSFYDSKLAYQVRSQCIELLSCHESSDKFICSVLTTLSFIASTSLSQISSHISLLFKYLQQDKSNEIRRHVQREIFKLAMSSPHLWTVVNFEDLLTITEKSSTCESNAAASAFGYNMQILAELIKCPSLLSGSAAYSTVVARVLKLCSEIIETHKGNMVYFSVSCSILSCIASSKKDPSVLEKTLKVMKEFISSLTTKDDADAEPMDTEVNAERIERESKKRRNIAVNICRSFVQVSCLSATAQRELVSALRSAVVSTKLPEDWCGWIAEALCAIGYREDCEAFALQLESLLLEKQVKDDTVLIRLVTIYLQSIMLADTHQAMRDDAFKMCSRKCIDVSRILPGRSLWVAYQIVRQAMRFGHHRLAQQVCSIIISRSSSEQVYFWVICLDKVCQAEATMVNHQVPLDERISRSIELYVEALSSLKSTGVQSNGLIFQQDYLSLRLKLLQSHEQLRQACKLVRSAPAPAIAATTALTMRDDLMKFGAIVTQMRKCAKDFRNVSDLHSQLFQSSFNADNETLAHLQLLQSSCTMIAEAIESLFHTNRVSSLFIDKHTHLENSARMDTSSGGPACEHQALIAVCHQISSTVTKELSVAKAGPAKIESRHISALEMMGFQLLSVPLSIPRMFFQSVQNVSVKLALSPQPKLGNEFVTVLSSHIFALKVEGVIITKKTKQLAREVSKVMLNVTTTSMMGPTKLVSEGPNFGKPIDTSLSMSSVVTPKNDYFSTQFLLNFNVSGIHSISVEASIIDENEAQWKTGPVISMSVKVLDDSAK